MSTGNGDHMIFDGVGDKLAAVYGVEKDEIVNWVDRAVKIYWWLQFKRALNFKTARFDLLIV